MMQAIIDVDDLKLDFREIVHGPIAYLATP